MARKSTKKKRKQGPKTPPLSFLDQCLYWLGFLGLIAMLIAMIVFPEKIIRDSVLSDPTILAVRSSFSFLRLPFILLVVGICLLFLLHSYDLKIPIIGHRKGKYCYPEWETECPLITKISQQHRKKEQDGDKGFRMWRSGLLVGALAFFLISVFSYSTLGFGGELKKSVVGIETLSSSVSSVENVDIYIKRIYKKRLDDYDIRISFRTDKEREIEFDVKDFSGNSYVEKLKQVLRLKAEIPSEKIRYSHLDLLEDYLKDDRPSAEEAKLIYDLLGLEQ